MSVEQNIRYRYELLADLKDNPKKQARIIEACRRDPVFWINNFCWTFDPRRDDFQELPFVLYPFQEWFIKQAFDRIENQEHFGVEKSRDMGASWMFAMLFQWCWMFKPGWNFLMGSYHEDFVDKIGDISSLFEKLRFNLRMQPEWLAPQGFDFKKHSNYMRLINPENTNSIRGSVINANFGRGGRYRAIFMDEMAFAKYQDLAWQSSSFSCRCVIVSSTPNGKHNRYGLMMTDPDNRKIEYGCD